MNYSNITETKKLLNKVNEWINKLEQKIKDRWLLEKWARTLAKWVDVVSMWTIRWFFTWLLPSNIWNKINNFIDIQWNLSNHLKNINKLLEKKDLNLNDINTLTTNIKENGNTNNPIRGLNNNKLNGWIKKPLLLPVWKTTEAPKTVILPSKKPIILKAKINKPVIWTTKPTRK